MKRIIALLLLTVILVGGTCEKKIYADVIVVGGTVVVGKALIELVVAVASAYGLCEVVDNLTDSSNYVLTKEELEEIIRTDNTGAFVYNDGSVAYENGLVLGGTIVQGREMYINPYLVNYMQNTGLWDKLQVANDILDRTGCESLYDVSENLKQRVTETQGQVANLLENVITYIADGFKTVINNTLVLENYGQLSESDIDKINSNTVLKEILSKELSHMQTYSHYAILQDNLYGYYYFAYSNDYIETRMEYGDEFQLHYGNNSMLYRYSFNGVLSDTISFPTATYNMWFGEATNRCIDIWFCDSMLSLTNTTDHMILDGCVYPLDGIMDMPSVTTKGILDGITDGALENGIEGLKSGESVLDMPEEEVKTLLGEDTKEGEYEKVTDAEIEAEATALPEAQEKAYDGILGWLSRLWELIKNIPRMIIDGITSLINGIIGVLETILDVLQGIAQTIINGLLTGLQTLFIPTDGFMDSQVLEIRENFSFADSIIGSANLLFTKIKNLNFNEPPVIYADFSKAESSLVNYGGQAPVFDLRWYARYKPTVDLLISGFLWIVFVWRMFVGLPNIISGVGNGGMYLDKIDKENERMGK